MGFEVSGAHCGLDADGGAGQVREQTSHFVLVAGMGGVFEIGDAVEYNICSGMAKSSLKDLWVASQGHGVGRKALGELFPWPTPSVLDSDISTRGETGESDQTSGQVDDPHRVTHVEHEDLGPIRQSADAWSTNCTASSTVMKYRVMSASVTVTGPPILICSTKVGITLPRLPRTLPNLHRGVDTAVVSMLSQLHHQLGDPLGGAHDG